MPLIPALRRLKQENGKYQASLGYIVKLPKKKIGKEAYIYNYIYTYNI
jgi:hypothetical protein